MQKLEMPRYLTLFSPALDWLLQCLAHKASDKALTGVLEKSREQVNRYVLNFLCLFEIPPDSVSPALDWLLQCLAHKASDKALTEVLEKTREQVSR